MDEQRDGYVSVSKRELQDILNRCKLIFADNLISEDTKKGVYDALKAALSTDAGFREVFDRFEAAEDERRKTVHDVLTADPVFLDMVEELKPEPSAPLQLYAEVADALGLPDDDPKTLDIAKEEYAKNGLAIFEQHDSGNNYINNNPVLKALLTRSQGNVFLGTNDETGEALIMTINGGYLDDYESDIMECIAKFKNDGQVTKKGKIYCTLSQLYRAQRHGAGTTRPTKEQRAELLKAVKAMASEERKIDFDLSFSLSGVMPNGDNAEFDGGAVRIVGFDEYRGKIQGQRDTLLIFDQTPILNEISEYMRLGEIIPQEIKAITQPRYFLEYKDETGQSVTRSFETNESRRKYCIKNGINKADITAHYEKMSNYKLTKQRIAIRHIIFNFAFSYLRARQAGKPHSNKLPYAAIWERSQTDITHREQLKRNKAAVAVIFDHLQRVGIIGRWTEYYNVGSTKPDGVQISIAKELKGGA